MKKRNDIEKELDLKYEIEQHEKSKTDTADTIESNFDTVELTDIGEREKEDLEAEKIVEKLMDDYEDDTYAKTDNSFLTYGQVSFYKDDDKTEVYEPEDEYDEEDDDESAAHTPSRKNSDLNRYLNIAILAVIVFILFTLFYLVRRYNAEKDGAIEVAETAQEESVNNALLDELKSENEKLKIENSNLRNELAAMFTESGAEVLETEGAADLQEQVPAGSAEVPPEEPIPAPVQIPEPAAPPKPVEPEPVTEEPIQEPAFTPTPEPTSEPEPTYTEYTIQEGDTLSTLSQKFYGTSKMYQKLEEANGITDGIIRVGQKIKVPN